MQILEKRESICMGQHDDFYLATREEAKEQIKVATEFIAMIEEYCINKLDIID